MTDFARARGLWRAPDGLCGAGGRVTAQNRPARCVVRLAPWLLEVVERRDGSPWDVCVGAFAKRRDAERCAGILGGSGA